MLNILSYDRSVKYLFIVMKGNLGNKMNYLGRENFKIKIYDATIVVENIFWGKNSGKFKESMPRGEG